MVVINYNSREVSCKIVYYGPGLSGKTTNLQYVHSKVPGKTKGDLISLATDADRTLYFDFLPINIGDINGFTTKFQLYTVPGQVFYNATRKLVLRGVDGIVFVADSQAAKADENIESLDNLKENLKEYGLNLATIPFVLQYNKRDLPSAMTVDELNKLLNEHNSPVFEASANKGTGVFDTLKYVIKLVLDRAKKAPETMKGMNTHKVEDAQLPPEQAVPFGGMPTAAAEPTGQSETAVEGVSGFEGDPGSRAPAESPELRWAGKSPGREQVGMPTAAAASAESAGNLPCYAGGREIASDDTDVQADCGLAEAEDDRSESAVAVADIPVGEGIDTEAVEEIVQESPGDPDWGHDRTEACSAPTRSGTGDVAERKNADSEEEVYRRLSRISEDDAPETPAAEDEPLEREAFAVPSMKESLRRKPKGRKKGFFLFRWLFRRG